MSRLSTAPKPVRPLERRGAARLSGHGSRPLPPEVLRIIHALADEDALRDHKRAMAERDK